MSNHQSSQPEDAPQALSPEAEAKRRDARRKFFLRASAGSGLLITTLYHRRSFGGTRPRGTYYLSSTLACTSIGGTPNGTTVTGSFTSGTRTVCDVP